MKLEWKLMSDCSRKIVLAKAFWACPILERLIICITTSIPSYFTRSVTKFINFLYLSIIYTLMFKSFFPTWLLIRKEWVVYDNVVQKRSWSKRDEPAQSTSKADIHQKKVILSVWWDFKGIVNFELLPRNQTINSNVYCRWLLKLNKEMKEKRPELTIRKGVIFHQDNARPHTSLVTCEKLLKLSFISFISKPFKWKNIWFEWGC